MKIVIAVLLVISMTFPVNGLDLSAPEVEGQAQTVMPEEIPSFGEGLWYLIKSAIKLVRPEISDQCKLCLSVVAVAMIGSVLGNMQTKTASLVDLVGVLGICLILLDNANTLIHIAASTVEEISNYGNLLLPVMTAALAAQGGGGSSAALYAGTIFFDSLLGTIVASLLVPMVYVFLVLVVANSALEHDFLARFRDFSKSSVTWVLKTSLYIFTGYMGITGVIAGGADKAALKAAKLTISGAVPVVGGIMSDASETILVGAGVVKNTVGIYGLVAVMAILIVPFLRIGIMYGLLKCTMALISVFARKKCVDILQGFSDGMGLLLGMTGAVSLLFLISIVCFLKGMGG